MNLGLGWVQIPFLLKRESIHLKETWRKISKERFIKLIFIHDQVLIYIQGLKCYKKISKYTKPMYN